VDRVSEVTRKDWDRVFEMNVYEFFNVVAYARDKANFELERRKEWMKRN
jgi:hypothetical protein